MSLRTILVIFLLPIVEIWGLETAPILTSYPKVNRIWVGLEDGVIRPNGYETIKTDIASSIVIHAKDGEILKKGQHWLTIDPDELNLERNALRIEEEKFKKKLKENQWNSDSFVEEKKLVIDNLKAKKIELNSFLDQDKGIGTLQERVKQGLKDIDRKINRIRAQIDSEAVKKELELLESEGRLDLKRKRKRLLLLEKRSLVKASFEGKLELSGFVKQKMAQLSRPDESFWIDPNNSIGTLVDKSQYEVVVKLTNPFSREIAPANLVVLLQDSQTGALVQGIFDRVEEIESGVGIKRNFIFKLSNADLNMAKHSSGESHFVHVYRKFAKAHWLIQKKDIAFIAPAMLKKSGWSGLVKHLWPQSTILQVGPQTIMIQSTDEN